MGTIEQSTAPYNEMNDVGISDRSNTQGNRANEYGSDPYEFYPDAAF